MERELSGAGREKRGRPAEARSQQNVKRKKRSYEGQGTYGCEGYEEDDTSNPG